MQITQFLIAMILVTTATVASSAEQTLTYDRIDLTVSAEREIANDTLIAVMFAQQEGTDARKLTSEVNQAVAKAVEQAKRREGIKVQTLDYTTTPIYRSSMLDGWRVRQSIRLESTDTAGLSDLIGDLQVRLRVGRISYAISPERRREAESALVTEAIGRFRERAQLVSREFDRSSYRLVKMFINSGDSSPRPMHMRAAMMESTAASPPTLEAGTQKVNLVISGTIELQAPNQ